MSPKVLSSTIIVLIAFLATTTTALAAVRLDVPFSSQAPFGDWAEPWQNACEETSIAMVDSFYSGHTTITPEHARDSITHAFNLKHITSGQSLDETAKQIVNIINPYYRWEAYVVANPRLDQMKRELAFGRPIILPAYGADLANPHYRSEQLDYHVLVIIGYDDITQEFITHDPGTKRGNDFRYSFDTVMNAMHDYIPGKGNTKQGQKVVIFTRNHLVDTKHLDADNDGLSKEKELQYHTNLWLADTDGDKYNDGLEVLKGYSPTIAEHTLPKNSLIKSKDDPRVFLLQKTLFGHKKRHITTMEAFTKNGYNWDNIITVSNSFINNLAEGKIIN